MNENTNSSFSKLLSVVVTGRNDNYMGNFKYRLGTCVNYLAHNLEKTDQLNNVEILITDWNSDRPLSKDLPLIKSAASITRFVYVPPHIASNKLEKGQVFNTPCAINASVRRAQGQYIMHLCSDTLVPHMAIQTILNLLNRDISIPVDVDRALFLSQWYRIPPTIIETQPSLDEWDCYLLMNARRMIDDSQPTGLGIGSSCWLMHRSLWHESQGYDERFIRWGWSDADLSLRICQQYPWVEMTVLGVSMFEMDHARTRSNAPINRPFLSSSFTVNSLDWGLGNYDLDIQVPELITQSSSNYHDLVTKEADPVFQARTSPELIDEILSEPVINLVNWAIHKFMLDIRQWSSMILLSWYVLFNSPRNYLELGLNQGFLSVLLAKVRSDINIFGVFKLTETSDDLPLFGEEIPPQVDGWQSGFIPYETKFLLKYSIDNYAGYVRYIAGSLSTATHRLEQSSIGELNLDIVLIHINEIEFDVVDQIDKSLELLRSNGIIILTGNNLEQFSDVWSKVQTSFQSVTYLELPGFPTGGILKSQVKTNKEIISIDLNQLLAPIQTPSDDHIYLSNLRRINLIAFVNWNLPEPLIREDLNHVFSKILLHSESADISLFLEAGNLTIEDMNLIISSVVMDLMMQHDLNESSLPQVTFLDSLEQEAWSLLYPHLTGCLPFKYLTPLALALTHSNILPLYNL